jgi:hypothetical protein
MTQEDQLMQQLSYHGDMYIGDQNWRIIDGHKEDFTIHYVEEGKMKTEIKSDGLDTLSVLLDRGLIFVFNPYDVKDSFSEAATKAKKTGKIENNWRILPSERGRKYLHENPDLFI